MNYLKFGIGHLIIYLLFIFVNSRGIIYGQSYHSLILNIGDKAPSLRFSTWLKGDTIKEFQNDNVYVLEFWATWCKPCIAAMPHLSSSARKYRNKAIFLSVNVFEKKAFGSDKKVKAFVDSMGSNMDYNIAMQDSSFMETNWLVASGTFGIPSVFIINREGKIAWIGHPRDVEFDTVLSDVLNNTWSITKALYKRNENRYLAIMDDSLRFELMRFSENSNYPNDKGKPDSALFAINEIVRAEPRLKYAPFIAEYTFKALLKIDQDNAYKYGKEVLETPTYEDPAYNVLIWLIDWYSNRLSLSPKIYRLGTLAYQMKIDKIAPEAFEDVAPKLYHLKARWHIRANEIQQAIEAEGTSINVLKRKPFFSVTEMNLYKSSVIKYKKMLP